MKKEVMALIFYVVKEGVSSMVSWDVVDEVETKASRRDRKNKTAKEKRIEKEKFAHEVKPPVQAKNTIQKEFLAALKKYDVVVFSAPAGVGKTYLTMSEVSDWLKKGEVRKVVLTRPAIPMGRSIGLVPGTVREKYELYLQPLLNVLWDRYGKNYYENCLSLGNIVIMPPEYVRGHSVDGVMILDEAQSFHPEEIYTLLTRVEEGGKLILIGDPTQNDLRGQNGIDWLCDFVEKNPELEDHIKIIEATSDDIVRGGLCKAVVKAKEKEVF